MISTTPTDTAIRAATTQRPGSGALRRLVRVEAKLFLRSPVGLVWVIAFPVLGIVVLGLIPGTDKPLDYYGGQTPMQAYLPIIAMWAIVMMAANVLPATLANYRERGILRRLATTPVPARNLLAAQVIVCAVIEIAVVMVVLAIAGIGFAAGFPAQAWGFLASLILAGAALMAIGLFVAAVSWNSKAANAIGTALLFVLMFFSGLWLPRVSMPSLLQHVSDLTPTGAAVQAFSDSSAGAFPGVLPLVVMAGYAVVFGALAVRWFRWE